MKGIAHFAVGVAAASCFPAAVAAGAAGNPLYFLLGGIFGLLPDTLDFRFARFFYRHDVEVQPDPLRPDPRMIADAAAGAVNAALASGKPVRIKFNTVPLSADTWQQYAIRFDVTGSRVEVEYGPVVGTDRRPVPGGVVQRWPAAAAFVDARLRLDYKAVTTIDIFDGPVFLMRPLGDGYVVPSFIPWHRAWSHSFALGLALALASALVWGPLAGWVVMAAHGAHVLADQLGFMGSRIWLPLSRRRIEGRKRMNAGDVLPNLGAVWLAGVACYWNLQRATAAGGDPLQLLFRGVLLPLGAVLVARRLLKPRGERPATASSAAAQKASN